MRKKLRLFIAVNLPERIKDQIEREIEAIRYKFTNDIRFLDRRNWHLTLIFFGYQPPEAMPAIVSAIEEAIKSTSFSEMVFDKLDYGPAGKPPKMIWLNGNKKTSASLNKLIEFLSKNLSDRNIIYKREHRLFHAHITLARFDSAKDLPDIAKETNFAFQPSSVELMESRLSRSGAEYDLLQSVKFQL